MSDLSAGREYDFYGGELYGKILDNAANARRQGNGITPLIYINFPERNIFRDDAVGLNFEHIMNGSAADAEICMFTPRTDSCLLLQHQPSAASIIHRAEDSNWAMDSEMHYTSPGGNCIDLEFKATPRSNRFPLGYVAFMWASYMDKARDRKIYFYGEREGRESWLSFGDDTEGGFETGTIAHCGAPPLPYEKGAQTLNIIENAHKKFKLPFYYGLMAGDGDLATPGHTMAYIMMFDQAAPIRFAMWNFITDSKGAPDPHSPAWDWQYVIQNPEVGRQYGYRARVIYKPFISPEDVEQEYRHWVDSLDKQQPARS